MEFFKWASYVELIESERARQNDGPIIDWIMDGELNNLLSSVDCDKPIPFTAWTEKRVYFAQGYDTQLQCRSVPRDPCGETTLYVGGGCRPSYPIYYMGLSEEDKAYEW